MTTHDIGFVDGHFQGRAFTCECGRDHDMPIREIIIKPGALAELPGVLRRLELGKQGIVIADLNTYDAAGAAVMEALQRENFQPILCLFQSRELVNPDEFSVGKVMLEIDHTTSFLLSVGTGCLTDLTRYISSRTGIPFLSVGTAASMDGYASSVAAMHKGHYKTTVPATYPQAIIADIDIFCQAPHHLTAAGFGDLIAKLNSKVEWQLSHLVTGEHYCEFIVNMVDDTVQATIAQAEGIRNHDPAAMTKLAEGLIACGIGMLMVRGSRPASGCEHHLSHYWEMKAMYENRAAHLHGTKVGVATGVIAAFFEKFFARDPRQLDLDDVKQRKESVEAWKADMRARLGTVGELMIAANEPFFLNWNAQKRQIERIQEVWDQIQALHAQEPKREEVIALMRSVGGAALPEDVDINAERLREGLLHAKDARIRYSVLRAAETLGWLEDITEEVVADYSNL